MRVNRARQFLELLIFLFARVTGCLRLPVYTSCCLRTSSFDYFHLRNVHLVLFEIWLNYTVVTFSALNSMHYRIQRELSPPSVLCSSFLAELFALLFNWKYFWD